MSANDVSLCGRHGNVRSRKAFNQRGAVALIVAIALPMLLALIGIVVDVGHLYLVRNQLQNASDAASLAGARSLNGQQTGLDAARPMAQRFAALHNADGSAAQISLNPTNAPDGDIVLGSWDGTAMTFTALPATTLPVSVFNAVKVTTHRDTTEGGPVQTFFASVLGPKQSNVSASAVAVAGGPSRDCAFPVAIASCALFDAAGNFQCPKVMSFGGNDPVAKNVGITTLGTGASPNGHAIIPLIKEAIAGQCTDIGVAAGDSIPLQNGNDLSKTSVSDINLAVARGIPIYVDLPVVDAPDCSKVIMNQSKTVVGFLRTQLTGASFPQPKAIYMMGVCDQKVDAPSGGRFFGLTSTQVRLVN